MTNMTGGLCTTVSTVTTGPRGLPHELWGLICELAAADALWPYHTWAHVCKDFTSRRARRFGRAGLTLDLSYSFAGQVPLAVLDEWRETKVYLHTVLFRSFSRRHLSFVDKLSGMLVGQVVCCGTSFDDKAIAHAARLTNLHTLQLVATDISDKGLAELARLPALRRLELESCAALTDEGVAHLAKLKSLHELNVSFCRRVTDKGVQLIAANLSELRVLRLAGMGLTDSGLAGLNSLERLDRLDVRYCRHITPRALQKLNLHSSQIECSVTLVNDMTIRTWH